nr:YchJ family protein [Cryobacterium serini]
MTLHQRCPCLSGDTYSECCGRFHSGTALPPTAEWLMRSRYSAFYFGDAQYLLKTWHQLTRPEALDLDPEITWRRLDIVRTKGGGLLDSNGIVEFTAHYRVTGKAGRHNEVSRFQKVDQHWYYLDAAPPPRNVA